MSDSQIKALLAHYRLHNRNAVTHVIRSAVSLGIIEALAEGQKTLEQLAEQLELQAEPLALLMRVLVETELVEQYGDDFALSTVARLIPRELRDFGDFHWSHLGDFVRSGVNLPNDDAIPATDSDFLAHSKANEWLATPAALNVAEVLDFGGSRKALRVLEIGSGSAVFGVTLIHRDPESRLVLLDNAAGLNLAKTTVDGVGVENRVELVEGDYLEPDLGDDQFDMVLMSGILHRHSMETCQSLFKTAHQLLKPGSEMVVVDLFPGQEKGELNYRVAELEIRLRTSAGQLHDPAQVQHEMIMQGFDQIQYAHLPAAPYYWGLILATRD
ncbi:MAG: class I SAM-dependent methyltransferase [Planctomycetota bacterium]|nr:class I SAM-dependent methyltransferase [Planctomycetota bacterium]